MSTRLEFLEISQRLLEESELCLAGVDPKRFPLLGSGRCACSRCSRRTIRSRMARLLRGSA